MRREPSAARGAGKRGLPAKGAVIEARLMVTAPTFPDEDALKRMGGSGAQASRSRSRHLSCAGGESRNLRDRRVLLPLGMRTPHPYDRYRRPAQRAPRRRLCGQVPHILFGQFRPLGPIRDGGFAAYRRSPRHRVQMRRNDSGSALSAGPGVQAALRLVLSRSDYWPRERKRGGQRSWTAMAFLNAVEEGGTTDFTAIGASIEPKPGALLIWNNANPDGSPNNDTIHAGTPVVKGHKIRAHQVVSHPHFPLTLSRPSRRLPWWSRPSARLPWPHESPCAPAYRSCATGAGFRAESAS